MIVCLAGQAIDGVDASSATLAKSTVALDTKVAALPIVDMQVATRGIELLTNNIESLMKDWRRAITDMSPETAQEIGRKLTPALDDLRR